MPPIFATEAPLGIADHIYGKARIISKGKLFNEGNINKDITKTSGEMLKLKCNRKFIILSLLTFSLLLSIRR